MLHQQCISNPVYQVWICKFVCFTTCYFPSFLRWLLVLVPSTNCFITTNVWVFLCCVSGLLLSQHVCIMDFLEICGNVYQNYPPIFSSGTSMSFSHYIDPTHTLVVLRTSLIDFWSSLVSNLSIVLLFSLFPQVPLILYLAYVQPVQFPVDPILGTLLRTHSLLLNYSPNYHHSALSLPRSSLPLDFHLAHSLTLPTYPFVINVMIRFLYVGVFGVWSGVGGTGGTLPDHKSNGTVHAIVRRRKRGWKILSISLTLSAASYQRWLHLNVPLSYYLNL